jgi:hypothetical protein
MQKGVLLFCTFVMLGLSLNVTGALLFNQTPHLIAQTLEWKPMQTAQLMTQTLEWRPFAVLESGLSIGREGGDGCLNSISFCAKEYLFDMDDHTVDLKEFIRSAQRNQRQLAWIMRQLAAYVRRKQKNKLL